MHIINKIWVIVIKLYKTIIIHSKKIIKNHDVKRPNIIIFENYGKKS